MNFLTLHPFLAWAIVDDAFYIYLAIAAITTAASTYASYSAQQTAAKQSELNAQAQADALGKEQQQRAQEIAEEQRRKAVEQHRFRATQLAEMSGQGIQLTGTPLDIMANTAMQQQQELNDIAYMGDSQRRQLAFQRDNALAVGSQQASQYRQQAGATLLSGASSIANIGMSGAQYRPKTS